MQETWVQSMGQEDPLEKGMATHSSFLSWRILWTEEPGGLESTGLQRVGHNGATPLTLSLNTFPGGLDDKYFVFNVGDLGRSLGLEDPLEKEMAIHSSILPWRIPWMEKSMRSQRVGHD